jgi:hypothetical protein
VLLEVLERLAVVEDHRGVEHEDLGGAGRDMERIAIRRQEGQGVRNGQGAAEGLVHGVSAYRTALEEPEAGGTLELRVAMHGGRGRPGGARMGAGRRNGRGRSWQDREA